MLDSCLVDNDEGHDETCIWKCPVYSQKALGKILKSIAKTLGMEVETVEAGDTSEASSLRGGF